MSDNKHVLNPYIRLKIILNVNVKKCKDREIIM